MVRLVVIAWLVVMAGRASADTIAMLPLDGEQRLEIYGQPVAAEIARALRAAGVDVVVVGARMEVPDRALLIVDGTIKAGKHDDITLSIRVRDPRDGTVLATVPAPTTSLDHLDKAAAELSARVVPSVKTQLDVLAKARAAETKPVERKPLPPRPAPPPPPQVTTQVKAHGKAAPLEQLRDALDREAALWAATQRYPAELAFDVLTFSAERGSVPMARARVRVEIRAGGERRVDRIVRTDTIVGDRGSTPAELAARTAREVIAIVQPNYRRALAPAR
jgi:hypothetical protein